MLSDQVFIARRFLRSVRVDADIGRADAVQGFVCQRSSADALLNMATQIASTKQRAYTWTGPYGGGKSSLAVSLAGLLGPKRDVRDAASAALGQKATARLLELLHPTRAGWLVVPVVGRRGDPVADIGAALEAARRKDPANHSRPRSPARDGRDLISRLTQEAAARPRDGVLLVIDELGKFLESAAAESKDIYFFQELAEAASRAQGRLVIVGILHQAFEQYASRLGRESRDEWAKIQGRYTDIPIIAGTDEVIELLGRAVTTKLRHADTVAGADQIAQSIRSRRPGTPANLGGRLDACWPLHPVTAAVLGPMSRRRFGQNERSIFGFLTSAEPGGFQEFLRTTSESSKAMFGPDRFWDYLRYNLEPAILASNDSHRWAQGVDAVERCEARGSSLHVRLAKTIALIDMFKNGSGMAADRVTLGVCAADASKEAVTSALRDLEQWSVAVFRKHTNAWAVYAGSDFDIDGAVRSALARTSELDVDRLAKLAGLQPVLAKRHYHATGTLRWFQTELVALSSLDRVAPRPTQAAGRFILAVPTHDESRKSVLLQCSAASANAGSNLVAIGYPSNASHIRELGRELIGLELVRQGHPELDGDGVARREIMARIAGVAASLEEELRDGFANADWFLGGERIELPPGTSLPGLASDLADQRFAKAPCIHSELLNRQKPSSNTQAGVRDLLHAMIAGESKPALGIDGFPVERGLYSTVLAEAGLHRAREDGTFAFSEPSGSKIGRSYRPAWTAAERLFAQKANPVSLDKLYKLWEEPPFGICRGIMPVLALAFILANRDRFAVYGEGRFQPEVDDYLADVLLQDEKLVALRRIDGDAYRGEILEGIARFLETTFGQPCPAEALAIARRLVRFATELPAWSQKTQNLPPNTIAVRRVLLSADDPHKSLFVDLPSIFGERDGKAAVQGIGAALEELRTAYPRMLVDLSRKMLRALGHDEKAGFKHLQKRASVVAELTGDLRVDAFAARLVSFEGHLADIESIASLSINRPPRDWTDRDPDQAALAIAEFALRFRKAEVLARVKGREPTREAIALIIGTGEAGQEVVEEFEVSERDRDHIQRLALAINEMLVNSGADRSMMLAALATAGVRTIAEPARRARKAG